MIQINIPNNNILEREYIIYIIFSQFLGLQYNVVVNNLVQDYVIELNEKKIIIKDHFFNHYPKTKSYLKEEAIPQSIFFIKNSFVFDANLPVIFGSEELIIKKSEIVCGIDIFSSSYFMITRWEEYVNKKRDLHFRFPVEESYAWKNHILSRPIVNEYVEMLWNMLVYLKYDGQRKDYRFKLVLTHDIDVLMRSSIRTIFGDVAKRKDLKLAMQNFRYVIGKDPYDTYDLLMSISEKMDTRSHFYFMATDSKKQYDTSLYLNRRKFKSVLKSIKDRGHIIGFHPGYYTYNDPQRWLYEKTMLEESVGETVIEGRHHFLRMEVPTTLNIWDNNNMIYDSTLGYAGKEGFKCGTGNEFQVFDFLNRKQLKLMERPLIIMDATLKNYRNYDNLMIQKCIDYYISIGKKYNTIITILFHNSSFNQDWDGYLNIYNSLSKQK